MTRRVASCPACGAELEFRNAGTLWVVCPYCGGASARTDLRLDLLGKVAALAPIPSPFALGERGTLDGKGFTAVGQVQNDHGRGPWNEWHLLFDDGKTGWLAEAQGEILFFRERPAGDAPAYGLLAVGARVDLGASGAYTVAEKGRARCVAARGEFPYPLHVGEEFRYADLRGPGKAVATLDYGDGDACRAVYAGKVCDPSDLALTAKDFARAAPTRTEAGRLACPKCSGQVDLRDPAAVRVTCRSCGSLLDTGAGSLAVIGVGAVLQSKPFLPLGSTGTLDGKKVEVLGFMVRSVTAEGVRYPWEEYLLRDETGGYRWLTRSDNHWSRVSPVNPGDAVVQPMAATYLKRRFRHFQGGQARVDSVLGEFYWEVNVGDVTKSDDYVAPPLTLSVEQDGNERNVTLCTYLPPAELQAAFALPKPPPKPVGVAPNQPYHGERAFRDAWKLFGVFAAAVIAVFIASLARAPATVVWSRAFNVDKAHTAEGAPPPAAADPAAAPGGVPLEDGGPGTEEPGARVVFSEPFELRSRTNLEVRLEAGVDNDWVGMDASLVDLDRGDVRGFTLLAQYYHGVTDGESWSEGSRSATVYLGPLEPGKYALRVEPVTAGGSGSIACGLRVRAGVASKVRPWVLLVCLLVPALAVSIGRAAFEGRRWSASDHAG